ncbi:MAG TPA: hypothetical protein DCE41_28465 [Cytophagales bacterium]|nr:hypothetical protein [Cytophagales bacterium]HAA20927.1 hypothetical protein [Cytophagales bacterium]HAP58855.1 hypothetical protein [Cytophagales bacterium]
MEKNVTVVVSHFVRKGKEQAFEQALKRVLEQAKIYPGYQGIQTLQQSSPAENEYILLIRFDSEPNYTTWKNSATRQAWAQELKEYVTRQSEVRYQEGIEFWFSLPQLATAKPPAKWKMALLTWMVIYPLVLTLGTLAGLALDFAPSYLRTLSVSLVLVPLMTWVVMPNVTKLFSAWLFQR